MLFSSLAEGLAYDREVPFDVWMGIVETLRYRYAVAPFDDIPRWGIRERDIIESILGKMDADAQMHNESIAARAGRTVRRMDAREAGTNPRSFYEDVIIPRAERDCALRQDLERMRIPALEGTEARELAFALVAGLQSFCAVAVLAKNECVRESAIVQASMVCACANVLFDEGIPPALVSDWGANRPAIRSESIKIDDNVLKALHGIWKHAACDLRFLMSDSPFCYDELALDVWHAETELMYGDYVALRSPAWWMRPVYRLPSIHDMFPVGIAQLHKLFKQRGGIGKAFVAGPGFHEASLTYSALRGMTAVLSMALARLYFEGSDSPSVRHDKLSANDVTGLEALHRELVDKLYDEGDPSIAWHFLEKEGWRLEKDDSAERDA